MLEITSYSTTHPGGLPVFSCVLRPDKGLGPFSVVIPFKFSNTSKRIINQVARNLEINETEISWREDLQKPEDVTSK